MNLVLEFERELEELIQRYRQQGLEILVWTDPSGYYIDSIQVVDRNNNDRLAVEAVFIRNQEE